MKLSRYITVILICCLYCFLSSALASPPSPTSGDAEIDFSATNPEVTIVPGQEADEVAQAKWMTDRGWVNGWVMKDVRFQYNYELDTLYVAINFHKIAGDADGDGNPGRSDPLTTKSGGVDSPGLSGRESIVLALDTDGDGKPDIVAGVPANKPQNVIKTAQEWFTIGQYQKSNAGLAYSLGNPIPQLSGELLFEPSAAHPDFEFTITNLRHVYGSNISFLQAFAGSPDDVVAGESSVLPDKGSVKLPMCPGGRINSNGQCVCQAGTHDSYGLCCPQNQVNNNGKCVPCPGGSTYGVVNGVETCSCPAGTRMINDLCCPPDRVNFQGQCVCPAGTHDSYGLCCPQNQVNNNGKCVPCPGGSTYGVVNGVETCSCPAGTRMINDICCPPDRVNYKGFCVCSGGTSESNGLCCPPDTVNKNGACVVNQPSPRKVLP